MSQNTSDSIIRDAAAAVTLFTRLPLWKLVKVSQGNYDRAVGFLPLAGWITGGTCAVLIYALSFVLPPLAAVTIALSGRLLLTGALHEDGLADFCDGFGGGYTKERILAIMKDSHIGTYGVIGLIIYFLTISALLSSLPSLFAAVAILASDPFSKLLAGQLTNILPYARPEGAKNKASYQRMKPGRLIIMTIIGMIPAIPLLCENRWYALAAILPLIVMCGLCVYMRRKIGGYTGDCCGATFILCEISSLIAITIIHNLL